MTSNVLLILKNIGTFNLVMITEQIHDRHWNLVMVTEQLKNMYLEPCIDNSNVRPSNGGHFINSRHQFSTPLALFASKLSSSLSFRSSTTSRSSSNLKSFQVPHRPGTGHGSVPTPPIVSSTTMVSTTFSRLLYLSSSSLL